ncbi:MAG: hypothetical protein LIP12_08225 [Clostridiales bacterium]|nr:hypothetical protein [Clostridiales bacterium]
MMNEFISLFFACSKTFTIWLQPGKDFTVISYFKELIAGAGAVRATLEKYVQ